MLKALTPDDLDPIMEKMATNIGITKPSNDGDIYGVTNYESKELNKIGANRYFGITIGGGYAFVQNVSKNVPAGFGLMGSYDMRNFIFNIKAEAYFSDVSVYYFNIDALYPLNSKKNTPFINGGMGYGGVSIYHKNENTNMYMNSTTRNADGGLILFAGGGYIINRNSDVSLRFSGNLYAPLFQVNNTMPLGLLFTVSLLFGR
jgi:hypothetical protein